MKQNTADRSKTRLNLLGWITLLSFLVGSCGMLETPIPTPEATPTPQPTPLPETLVTFRVKLPTPPLSGETVYLTVLDEVTGLAFNPQRLAMTAEDALNYILILPFPLNSVVKYRYVRQGEFQSQEHTSDGRAVRYRIYQVDGPGLVQDVVSRWTDTTTSGGSGRIDGEVVDDQDGLPIPNVLITAGGAQTLTSSDGTYLIEGLPPGTHNLVVYALDGTYRTYQQGALVEEGKTTPAPIRLRPAPLVNLVFTVAVPPDTLPAVPLRFAGNLSQLGNAFSDLSGGVSTLVMRMPVLAQLPDGRYTLTLTLPAGADLRYKYTLGDGFWNSEQNANGGHRLRELIVPETNSLIEDSIDSWSSNRDSALTFDLMAPDITPGGEMIYLQLNPGFGWTEPLPMWYAGNQRWIYRLTSPLEGIKTLYYRYCRESDCEITAETITEGAGVSPDAVLPVRAITITGKATIQKDQVESWNWFAGPATPPTVPNITILPRAADFIMGVAIQADYNPSWGHKLYQAIQEIHELNASTLVLAPTWSIANTALPLIEPIPGNDLSNPELARSIIQARDLGMDVGIYASIRYAGDLQTWWQQATRDFPWWVVWFDRYQHFILDQVELAGAYGAGTFILGGGWIEPALPGGVLADGSASNVPEDAEARWRALIDEIRARYSGKLLWALNFPQGVDNPPPFLDALDGVYLGWAPGLSDNPDASEADLHAAAGSLLDERLKPFQEGLGKPIVLALAYPSASGGLSGCVPHPEKDCLALEQLTQVSPLLFPLAVHLEEQVAAYNATLLAINERDWIAGVVSQGYYPVAMLHDPSASVHGKPAAGAVWFWFQQLQSR